MASELRAVTCLLKMSNDYLVVFIVVPSVECRMAARMAGGQECSSIFSIINNN
jgi:hypothetical protein